MVFAAFRCALRRASTVAAAVTSDTSWAMRWDEELSASPNRSG